MWLIAQADPSTGELAETTNAAPSLGPVVQNGPVNVEAVQSVAMTYIPAALTVLLILAVAYLVSIWASRAVTVSLIKSRVEETLARFFGKVVKTAIMIIAVVVCLSRFGVDTTSVAAVLAAAGFAIGLAFQGTLANFSAGVMLLVFRPFKVGDVVNVAGITAKVFEIDLFTTTMDTPDNRRIILPNSAIFGSTIENITHHDIRRVDVNVGVSYNAPIAATRAALEEAAAKTEGGLTDPAPAVVLGDLADSSVNWTVRLWANKADFWDVKQRLTEAIKTTLDEKKLEIPFPQMDVHIKQEQSS